MKREVGVQLPIKTKNFFRLCHLFDPLLHLVVNVISKLKMHEDMFSPWRGECDSYQCLSSLAV